MGDGAKESTRAPAKVAMDMISKLVVLKPDDRLGARDGFDAIRVRAVVGAGTARTSEPGHRHAELRSGGSTLFRKPARALLWTAPKPQAHPYLAGLPCKEMHTRPRPVLSLVDSCLRTLGKRHKARAAPNSHEGAGPRAQRTESALPSRDPSVQSSARYGALPQP